VTFPKTKNLVGVTLEISIGRGRRGKCSRLERKGPSQREEGCVGDGKYCFEGNEGNKVRQKEDVPKTQSKLQASGDLHQEKWWRNGPITSRLESKKVAGPLKEKGKCAPICSLTAHPPELVLSATRRRCPAAKEKGGGGR